MCGVRDRSEQDRHLVRLAALACEGNCVQARLMLLEMEDERKLWTESAQYTPSGLQSPQSSAPHVERFLISSAGAVVARLEILASAPLFPTQVRVLEALVLAYQNLLELLDFGERDALTTLLNRKSFDRTFAQLANAQVVPAAEPLSLGVIDRRMGSETSSNWIAVLDIDHFKRVNDQFGHLIGDEVLVLIARLMQSNFRSRDKLYRFGGEEFVVLMQGVSSAQASAAFERLRSRIAGQFFPQVGTITLSAGYTKLLDDDTPTAAVGRADKAVYFAKANGRNQVLCFETLVSEGRLAFKPDAFQDVDFF